MDIVVNGYEATIDVDPDNGTTTITTDYYADGSPDAPLSVQIVPSMTVATLQAWTQAAVSFATVLLSGLPAQSE